LSATAFGDADGIYLMVHEDCGEPLPQSGATQLGIAKYDNWPNEGGVVASAFSFDLSSPIVAGEMYELEFYAYPMHVYTDFYDVGYVEIGISTSPTSFGTLVFTGMPEWPENGWTLLSTTFSAPIAATYLTVRAEYGAAAGSEPVSTQIDNFSLAPAGPTSTDTNTWGRIKSIYRE
jgi:hypothetical protein